MLKVAGIVLLCSFLYAETALGLFRDWWDETSLSYGLLMVPMALYLAWMDRQRTLSIPVAPTGKGAWMIALSGTFFLFGRLSATEFFSRMAMVLCLCGIVWTFWGTARFLSLGRPLILLAAMVPPPGLIVDRISLPLRLLASTWATTLAQAVGVSVSQEGNVIHLATTSLGVADACSGLSSLLAMFVTALLMSFMLCQSVWRRSALALLSIPIAVLFNIIRITGTAVLADYQPEAAMGFYHLFGGWFVFVLGALSVYGAARLLARFE